MKRKLFIILLTLLALYGLKYAFKQNSAIETISSGTFLKRNEDNAETPEEVYVSPISIDYLRSIKYGKSKITIEDTLPDGSNYKQFLASYTSEGNKIYGLLAVPTTETPEGGFSAIVFNHGYIPPKSYKTTEGYAAYVDYLARNGFVVFKIDLRGNGDSEGISTGSYFSPGYTVDAIYALKALQDYGPINPKKIGIWGHSMAGNLSLRAMLVSSEFRAGVIWAGAVYSYEDFGKYGISDSSYVPRERTSEEEEDITKRNATESSEEIRKLRSEPDTIDFNNDFWKSISLTSNIDYLSAPIQINHAVNDNVVNIGYSRDLAKILEENEKDYEFYEYAGGGHNIQSPYFETAMQRAVDFFKENL